MTPTPTAVTLNEINLQFGIDYPADGDPYDAERMADFDVPDERHEYRDEFYKD